MEKKSLIFIFVFLISASYSFASIEVSRIYPKEAVNGQIVDISIKVKNNDSQFEQNFELFERISPGALPIEAANLEEVYIGFGEVKEKRFYWKGSLNPGQELTYQYKIQLNSTGTYNLFPTRAVSQNEVFMAKADTISVLCNPDNICGRNENSFNCLSDCDPSGKACSADFDCSTIMQCGSGRYYTKYVCSSGSCIKNEEVEMICQTGGNKKFPTGYFIFGAFIVFAAAALIILKNKLNPKNEQLFGYVNSTLRKGYTKEQIRKALVKSGYSNEEIEEVFKKIR